VVLVVAHGGLGGQLGDLRDPEAASSPLPECGDGVVVSTGDVADADPELRVPPGATLGVELTSLLSTVEPSSPQAASRPPPRATAQASVRMRFFISSSRSFR
jgi:hypothetical protein